jgi:enterobactin synthetase component D
MQTQRSIIQLAGHSLQRVDFDPATFQPEDLLWLPHYARLSGCARKRQTEHLAGRIAAVYALREVGEKEVPAIGDRRQPLWPAPWYGSISHCERSALAVVSAGPVGVDIERILSPWRPSWKAASSIARKKPAGRQRPAVGAGADAGVFGKRERV